MAARVRAALEKTASVVRVEGRRGGWKTEGRQTPKCISLNGPGSCLTRVLRGNRIPVDVPGHSIDLTSPICHRQRPV